MTWLASLDLVMQGDQVKRGQVMGYVEQLGTFVAVEVSRERLPEAPLQQLGTMFSLNWKQCM
jgi:hypothetical protein